MKLEREFMRGAGTLAVLKLLAQREMYGYELAEALTRESEGVLAMGHSTLYPMLYNLGSKGLIQPNWRESDGGRRRKYYKLTAAGKKWLDAHENQWQRLVRAMARFGIGKDVVKVTARGKS